jgi:vacuolar protein sorting-associated protein 13A/C
MLATLIPSLSDAPVRLPGKVLTHTFLSPSETMENIRKFYITETLKQIYKIVGSLDFVGNPTMFVTSFFSGVRDLVMAPSVAFIQAPKDPSRVGIGVATGVMSLVSHSTSGFFGVLANLSTAAGHGVATLSLDTDFRDWHRDKVVVETTNLNREWKRRGVQHAGKIITRPFVDIILGVSRGITGLVVSPIKGFRKNGRMGLVRGIAVGGIGLITKPSKLLLRVSSPGIGILLTLPDLSRWCIRRLDALCSFNS